MAAGALAERLGIANATSLFDLKDLADAQRVTGRQVGWSVYYSANFGTMTDLVAYPIQ